MSLESTNFGTFFFPWLAQMTEWVRLLPPDYKEESLTLTWKITYVQALRQRKHLQ